MSAVFPLVVCGLTEPDFSAVGAVGIYPPFIVSTGVVFVCGSLVFLDSSSARSTSGGGETILPPAFVTTTFLVSASDFFPSTEVA